MIRLFITLLLAAAPVAAQTPWPSLAAGFTKSVPRVEIQEGDTRGVCSAVVFRITEGVAHALTAAHCVTAAGRIDVTVDGRNASVQQVNRILDLAIVQFRANKTTTVMALAPEAPPAGSEVAVAGYAFAVEDIVVQFGRIAQSYNRESKTMWVNADIIFGDSGGAIIDDQGRLVGVTSAIVSHGPAHIGSVVRTEAIRDFVDDYESRLKRVK